MTDKPRGHPHSHHAHKTPSENGLLRWDANLLVWRNEHDWPEGFSAPISESGECDLWARLESGEFCWVKNREAQVWCKTHDCWHKDCPTAPIAAGVSIGEPTPVDRKCEPSGPTTRENGLQPIAAGEEVNHTPDCDRAGGWDRPCTCEAGLPAPADTPIAAGEAK